MFRFLFFCLLCVINGEDVSTIFSDITTSVAYKYGLKDSTGYGMDCLHIERIRGDKVPWDGDTYFGLYHSFVDPEYEVRLASSSDLIFWTFRRTILNNADMPFPKRVTTSSSSSSSGPDSYSGSGSNEDGWILLAHEQWMSVGSQYPSQLGFKLYYNESDLLAGIAFNSYVAPLSVGQYSQLEGTPSIYNVNFTISHQGLWYLNADVGFHFNNDVGVDQVAYGTLFDFGPTVMDPAFVGQEEAVSYNQMFINQGGIGNIGQRAPGYVEGIHINAQEANIGSMPPTIWEDWRVWLYIYGPMESSIPKGGSLATVVVLDIKTHGGSTAIGNPSFQIVPCPMKVQVQAVTPGKREGVVQYNCIFISYFIFSEGAADGESGVVVFYKNIDSSYDEK